MGGNNREQNEKKTPFKSISSFEQNNNKKRGGGELASCNRDQRSDLTFNHNNVTLLAKCELFFSTV